MYQYFRSTVACQSKHSGNKIDWVDFFSKCLLNGHFGLPHFIKIKCFKKLYLIFLQNIFDSNDSIVQLISSKYYIQYKTENWFVKDIVRFVAFQNAIVLVFFICFLNSCLNK